MLLYSVYFILTKVITSAEVFTFIKDDKIICGLTNESVDSATFLTIFNGTDDHVFSPWRDPFIVWNDLWNMSNQTSLFYPTPGVPGDKFLFSRSASLNNETSLQYIIFGLDNYDCIYIYVSIDQDCYLDIKFEPSNNYTNQRIEGFNNPNQLKQWKRFEIKFDHDIHPKELYFFCGRNDNGENGYWAVHTLFSPCESKSSNYIHRLNPKDVEQSRCTTLETNKSSNIICNKKGYFGENCDISCENFGFSEHPICGFQKICNKNKCRCGWGYLEPDCKDKKNPVVLEPPRLISVNEKTILIDIGDLQYSEDEIEPEFYRIQYKKSQSKIFENYTDWLKYPPCITNRRVAIRNLLIYNSSYSIRILLKMQNHSSLLDYQNTRIPELLISDEFFKTFDENNHEITELQFNGRKYLLQYKCSTDNSNNFSLNRIRVEKKVLLKNVEFVNNDHILMEFDNFSQSDCPLGYLIECTCLDKWCNREDSHFKYSVPDKCERVISITLEELRPFTTYGIKVTTIGCNQNNFYNFTKTTHPSRVSSNEAVLYVMITLLTITIALMLVFGVRIYRRRKQRTENRNEDMLLLKRQTPELVVKEERNTKISSLSKNLNKNRDPECVPFDDNRVVLHPFDGVGSDDYTG